MKPLAWIRRVAHPTSVVYLLVHLLLIIGGYALYKSDDSPLWTGVASSIVATGFAGLVIFGYLLLTIEYADLVKVISRFGLVNAFEGRGVRERNQYKVRLERASEHIDILGFGLKALREDFLDDFASWKRRAEVRILLIDPSFPVSQHANADQRDSEEGNPAGSIRSDVEQFLTATRHLRDARFQVRLYRCLPSVNIFRVDDEAFWGPYLLKRPSRNMPTFIVHKGGLLFDQLLSHFECIWDDDRFSRPPE